MGLNIVNNPDLYLIDRCSKISNPPSRKKIASPGESTTRTLIEKELSYRRALKRECVFWMNKLREYHPYCYGSIARGDIELNSDADIIIDPTASYKYEPILSNKWISRTIIQTTPNHGPKVVYELPNKIHISVPFTELSSREIEFLSFGGKLNLPNFQNGEFSIGINKRLMLVEPLDRKGYSFKYTSIKSMPIHVVARRVNCGVEVILERIRVLTKRDRKGRTGVYLHHPLNKDEQPEEILRELIATNIGLKKTLARRHYR
ncbi:MAG: hypothetical protein ACFFD1_08290 [Candidatus Thorarchaeota archaeon]